MTLVRIAATVVVDIDLERYVRRNRLPRYGSSTTDTALHGMEVCMANAICKIASGGELLSELDVTASPM